MLNITESAAKRIQELVAEDGRTHAGLRLYVDSGGCSGMQYNMSVDDAQPDDIQIEEHGGRLYVEAKSYPLLKGSVIDFVDSLTNTGFRIVNPNAKQTCGCGTSFEA